MNESSGSDLFSEDNDVINLKKLNKELVKKNKDLNENIDCLKEEKLNLQNYIQKLHLEFISSQNPIHENNFINYQNINRNDLNIFPDIENKDSSSNYSNTVNQDSSSSENLSTIHSVFLAQDNEDATRVPFSEQFLQQNDKKCVLTEQKCDTFDNSSNSVQIKDIQKYSKNAQILSDFKAAIDALEENILSNSGGFLADPRILHLRRIYTNLEEMFSTQSDNVDILNVDNFIENFTYCFTAFVSKYNSTVDLLEENIHLSVQKNQNLYSQITTLKDVLRSYGFLKVSKQKCDIQNALLLLNNNSFPSIDNNYLSFDFPHEFLFEKTIVPLVPIFNSMLLKLQNLNEHLVELQSNLDSSHALNDNLISRVQDQEVNLRGITRELEESQHILSVLKNQHKELQSAKSISKYDLQEKRKLLTKLRQQLENTREDFNLVRMKNSKSEAEWQDLRKEFVLRHKQTSEESGFVDDKGSEECESGCSNSICSSSSPEATSESITLNNVSGIIYQEILPKKSRLELLEEQCQHLYSSLLQSSKRHLEIDKNLEKMCKRIEKSNNRRKSKCDFKINRTRDNISNESSEITANESAENVIFTPDNFVVSSPYPNSDVSNLFSESNSCISDIYVNNSLSDCESLIVGSPNSVTTHKVQTEHIHISDEENHNNQGSVCNTKPTAQNIKCKRNRTMSLSCKSLDMCDNAQCSYSLESLCSGKEKIEEPIKPLVIDNICNEDPIRCLGFKTPCHNEDEKQELIAKVKDLENKNFMLSDKLDTITQELFLTESSKECEVSSLQFQLKTEAIKYETSLKEFSEQGKRLESMKQKITEQEDLILALEEALNEIRLDHENEIEEQFQELEDIHFALQAREEECATLSQDLKTSIFEIEAEKSKNEMLITQLEDLKAFNEKDKECLISELVDLQNDSKELKKKLIKLLKEKDILWRKNNYFYCLQQVKINDRWMMDSEVTNCLGCKNRFSFILRKHHCRLCGRIFCYSCANNWLLTTASSKKLRTCNECFMQYTEMKNDVRRGSNVPHVEENDYEEFISNLPFIQTRENSFNHEMSPSINSSLMSLPMTQTQKSHVFSSVPDLHYATNLEVLPCNMETRLKEISTDEIKGFKYGFSSEFMMSSGEQIFLPIFCCTCPILLDWSFKSNIQDIPIMIKYTGRTCDYECITRGEEKLKMQDNMKLLNPGYYVFHFDNRFRHSEVKIKYKFLLLEVTEPPVE